MEFNLADLFEHIADAVPEREAVSAGGRILTYRELDRLAHHFAAAGLGAGDHVGCHLMNEPYSG